jgi:hypothetical protein
LVLWAHALGVSRIHSGRGGGERPEPSLWIIQAGKLKLVDTAQPGVVMKGGVESKVAPLGAVLERGFAKPEIRAEEIEVIRGDVREMMRMVRVRLEGSAWELCKFLLLCHF